MLSSSLTSVPLHPQITTILLSVFSTLQILKRLVSPPPIPVRSEVKSIFIRCSPYDIRNLSKTVFHECCFLTYSFPFFAIFRLNSALLNNVTIFSIHSLSSTNIQFSWSIQTVNTFSAYTRKHNGHTCCHCF